MVNARLSRVVDPKAIVFGRKALWARGAGLNLTGWNRVDYLSDYPGIREGTRVIEFYEGRD
jgi:hypothetical protein